MACRLTKVAFTPDMIGSAMVQGFDCGPEPWAVPVAMWLKAPAGGGGAVDDMAKHGNRVWLFVNPGGELVGVGSLGRSSVRWPDPDGKGRFKCSIIPWVGVDSRHQRLGYGEEIMLGIITEAQGEQAERPLLSLFVDAASPAASGLYYRLGFRQHGGERVEPDSGRPHICMVRSLTNE